MSDDNNRPEDWRDKLLDDVMNDPTIPDSDPNEEITFEDPGAKYVPENKPKQKKSKKDKDESEDKDRRPRITISKYSSGPTGRLYESVFVANQPWFVYADNEGMLKLAENIQEDDRVLIPPSRSECFTKPYMFADAEELNHFWSQAKNLTINDLFRLSRKIWNEYIYHKPYIIDFLAATSILTYFQDRFSTIFYPFIIGDTASGKGTILEVAEQIVYRPYRATSVSEAAVFRTLSTIESGQAIMLLDEVNRMSEPMMEIHKGGYKPGSYVIRVDEIGGVRRSTKFLTFGMRWFVAEKSLDGEGSKGLNERCFYIHTIKGRAKQALWKVLSPAYASMYIKRLQEFDRFRKTLLLYRLSNFDIKPPKVILSHGFREEELVSPMLGLFYGTQYQGDILESLNTCLEDRNKVKLETMEALLFGIITKLQSDKELIEDPDRRDAIEEFNMQTPGFYAASLERIDDLFLKDSESEWKFHKEGEPSRTTMISKRFGEISAKQRTGIFKDKFGGISIRLYSKMSSSKFRAWMFPLDILNSLHNAYSEYKKLEILGIESNEVEDYK